MNFTSIGESAGFTATVRDQGGNVISGAPVAWSTENGSVATVSDNGTVTAAGNGTTQVTATSGSASASASVTVNLPVATVSVAPTTIRTKEGEQAQLTATAKDATGAVVPGAAFNWNSGNPFMVTVDGSGLLTGQNPGTTFVTASLQGDPSKSAIATVIVDENTPVTELQDGVPITVTDNVEVDRYFKISVPSGTHQLQVRLFEQLGSADFWVRRGSLPTASQYDCFLPEFFDSEMFCSFDNPQAGDWFVRLKGFVEGGVDLAAYALTNGDFTQLQNGVQLTGVSAGRYVSKHFRIDVPTGTTTLRIATGDGSGSLELFARQGAPVVFEYGGITSDFQHRGGTTTNRTIEIPNPTPGPWWIAVEGGPVGFTDAYVLAEATDGSYPLSVTWGGTGSGDVFSIPAGIDCVADCTAQFPEGTIVTLEANATSGSFYGFDGDCVGSACQITMDGPKNVGVYFGPTRHTLTVAKLGTGTGTVVSVVPPGPINCGTACSADFTEGLTVVLNRSAAAGSTFVGWGGACTGTGIICTVTMNSETTVYATFNTTSPSPLPQPDDPASESDIVPLFRGLWLPMN